MREPGIKFLDLVRVVYGSSDWTVEQERQAAAKMRTALARAATQTDVIRRVYDDAGEERWTTTEAASIQSPWTPAPRPAELSPSAMPQLPPEALQRASDAIRGNVGEEEADALVRIVWEMIHGGV